MLTIRNILAVLFACFSGSSLQAQNAGTYVLKSGESLSKVYPKEIYRYPEFRSGTVFFKNGNRSASRLNYNMWLEEMQFIQNTGDTMSIDNEQTIDYITIEEDTFVYDRICLELISSSPVAKLAGRQRIVIKGREKIGAYGQPTSTSAIDSYQYFTQSENQRLNVRENLLLGKRMNYYIGNRFNRFVLATRRNISNAFPKHEAELTSYLKEHEVDLNKQEDLEKLIAFLNTLQ